MQTTKNTFIFTSRPAGQATAWHCPGPRRRTVAPPRAAEPPRERHRYLGHGWQVAVYREVLAGIGRAYGGGQLVVIEWGLGLEPLGGAR